MHWTVEEWVLLATGGLFAVVLVLCRATHARLSRASYVVFSLAGVVCVTAALALSTIETVWFPPVLLSLPIVPLVVIAVLIYEAVSRGQATPQHGDPVAHLEPEPQQAAEHAGDRVFIARPAVPQRTRGYLDSDIGVDDRPANDAAARARAHNPHTAATELAALAYGYPALRAAVAANPATPATVLEWLAKSGDPVVTAAISARGSSLARRDATADPARPARLIHGSTRSF